MNSDLYLEKNISQQPAIDLLTAMGYTYTGKLRSAEVLLCEDGSHRLIRRAETPRDYFATLDFLPFMKPLLGEYNDD